MKTLQVILHIACCFSGAIHAAPLYNITSLNFNARAINDYGDIAGTIYVGGNTRGHVNYSDGRSITLGALGGTSSIAYDINNHGQVVGYAVPSKNVLHAFVTDSQGNMTDLGTLGGEDSEARAINNQGWITGITQIDNSIHPANGQDRAFIRNSEGNMSQIETSCELFSEGLAINNSGQVAGRCGVRENGTLNYHAFVTDTAGDLHDLGTLGGSVSSAIGMNDHGQIVGHSYTPSNSSLNTHAFVATIDGGMLDLGTFSNGTRSIARDINNSGVIIGSTNVGAFFYTEADGMLDLTTLLVNQDKWASLNGALSINENGQIIGFGQYDTGEVDEFGWAIIESRSFLMSPVPIPATAWLFASGLLVLVSFKRNNLVNSSKNW